jgi:hypothetical protein
MKEALIEVAGASHRFANGTETTLPELTMAEGEARDPRALG